MLANHSLFGAQYANSLDIKIIDEWTLWRNETKHIVADTPYDCGFTLRQYIVSAVDEFKSALLDEKPLQISFSGGKDSSCVVILFIIAMMELKRASLLSSVVKGNTIISANTRSENPRALQLMLEAHTDLSRFIEKEGLPITLILAEPNTNQTLIGRIVTGRGLPSYSNKSAQCSIERKLIPTKSALSRFYRENNIDIKKTVVCLGSRDSESQARRKSLKSFGGTNSVKFSTKSKRYEFYAVKNWTVIQIWDLLNLAGSNQNKVIPSYSENFVKLAEFYRDATGECNYNVTISRNNTKQEGCSSRSGCFDCLRVQRDKSAEQLSKNKQYEYLKPLLHIRQFLSDIERDWSRRNLLGRTLYSGFSRLRPDVFDFNTCRTLLAALITADVDEDNRAYKVAEQIESGQIEDNPANRYLSKPQFRHVMPKDVIGVEMMWSLHTFNANTFEAISLYTQIWNGDESVMERLLDHDPLHGNKNKVAATTQPAGYWLYCGERSTEPESYLYEDWLINDINEWSHCNGHKLLGLRDILGEFSETATAQHIYKKRADGSYYNDMMCEFNELDAFDIDDEMAEEILSWPEYYLNLKSSQQLYLPQHAAVKFLKLGVVKLGKGKERIYQSMSRRAQYYAARHLTGGLSWSDIDKIKQRNDLVLLTKTQFDAHKLRLVMLYQQLACIVVSCHSASFINAINQEENINKMEVFQSVFTDAIGRYYINQNNSEKSKVLLNRIFDSTMSNAQELASGIVISNKEFLLDDIVTTFFCNLKSGSLLISEELILAGGFDKFKAIATELFMKLEFNEYPIISDTCSSHIIMRIDTSKEKHLTQTSLF